ncbi:putative diacylglycerol o-acyltransferase [Scheffersomyces amazonensis]|uniref:putative diacylglycerol o-acyltransferase n=1 Tax=Scheffersomyces amazonensis TaxID=1078765 RepID=UPI00315DA659
MVEPVPIAVPVPTPDQTIRHRKGGSEESTQRHFVHIAPLNTPLRQRLQTIGVIWHTVCIPFFICLFLFAVSLGWVVWGTIILPYFIWWYGFDLHTPTNGKVVYRVRDWMTNLVLWDWFVNYFPIRLHKSVDLEPTFTEVFVEDDYLGSDDEEDLISEESRTFVDIVFKRLGLRKRLNDSTTSLNSVSVHHSPHHSNSTLTSNDKSSSVSSTSSYSSSLSSSSSSSGSEKRSGKVKRISTGPRYIFGYHPHGVISMGCMGLFATNAIRNEPYHPPLRFLKSLFHDTSKGIRQLPGIGHVFPLTITTQFTIPFYRDYLLSLGLTSASAKNIKSLINNGDNSVCIVVGGAQESLLNNMVGEHNNVGIGFNDSNPNQVDNKDTKKKREIKLVLHKRKGFVKLAIETGNVSLVPTFAFGEADLYKLTIPEKGSFGYAFQQWLKTYFKFTIPFFSARGVFIYDFGFLPYRNPINVCMGRPIHIPTGTLEKYKLEHPEFDEQQKQKEKEKEKQKQHETHDSAGVKKLLRKDSFTNLFKYSDKPRHSTIKTKIPQELLDFYHKLYVDELKRVFEENKHKYGYGDVQLNIIE